MVNPSFKELSNVSESRYAVCVMVMKRARMLVGGSKALVRSKGQRPVTVALDEIMHGKVVKKEATVSVEPQDE